MMMMMMLMLMLIMVHGGAVLQQSGQARDAREIHRDHQGGESSGVGSCKGASLQGTSRACRARRARDFLGALPTFRARFHGFHGTESTVTSTAPCTETVRKQKKRKNHNNNNTSFT
ncbi:hypothetical protein B0I35DRAFT_162844 [Stachybotrys elegans]|uniref:Secreted protein n=1 Tax=Stachybotrys elegans TaxID=80388 RepID=A0A8K0STF6_9HYPO|nr:hypothetical protein B0I35DRAFT_162844 [Stachybotrys elegans]